MSRAARPHGHDALVEQAVPHVARVVGAEQDLDAVLAGVARAADERGNAVDAQLGGLEAAGELGVGQAADVAAGLGALDGEHRVVGVAVDDLDAVGALGLPLDPGEVLAVVGRVGDRQEAVVAQVVGEEVVEDPAVLAGRAAEYWAPPVDSLSTSLESTRWRNARAPRPAGLDLAHVGDVEDAGALAHGGVLLAHALVLDGHLPAGEGHELRARLLVAAVERSAKERVAGGHGA